MSIIIARRRRTTRKSGAAAVTRFSDTFARTAGTLGTADVGGAWTQHAGTISTDGANANQGSLVLTYASLQGVVADGTLSMHTGNTTPMDNVGVLFRFVDANNYWFCVGFAQNLYVKKVVASVPTTVTSGVATGTIAPGDLFQVVLSGSSITTKFKGATIHAFSDPDLATATRHGVYSETNTLGVWQDISFVSP